MLTGTGFAFDGAARCSYRKLTAVDDSGIIEIFTAPGVGVGTLLIIGWIGAVSFLRPADATSDMILYYAMALSLLPASVLQRLRRRTKVLRGLFLDPAAARLERQRMLLTAASPASNGRATPRSLVTLLALRRLV